MCMSFFSCIELVSVSELHFLHLADSLMWSLSSGQDIFSVCNMAGSEDLHLHFVSSMVTLGHHNFQPLLSKIFKAVLLPSWYFSVIVLLCLSPIWCAVHILQIHLYSLTFIIWDLGRLLMPYLWLVLSLCYCSHNCTKGPGFVQLMAVAVYGMDGFIWNYISFAGQHNCAVSPEVYILRNFCRSDGSVCWHRILFEFVGLPFSLIQSIKVCPVFKDAVCCLLQHGLASVMDFQPSSCQIAKENRQPGVYFLIYAICNAFPCLH